MFIALVSVYKSNGDSRLDLLGVFSDREHAIAASEHYHRAQGNWKSETEPMATTKLEWRSDDSAIGVNRIYTGYEGDLRHQKFFYKLIEREVDAGLNVDDV